MSRFQAAVRFDIHLGKGEEFQRIADNMIRLTREGGTGTVRLDIFVNHDGCPSNPGKLRLRGEREV